MTGEILGRGRSLEVTLTVDSTCLFLASGLGAEGHSGDGVRRVGGQAVLLAFKSNPHKRSLTLCLCLTSALTFLP